MKKLILAVAIVAFASSAQALLIAQHWGTNNPETEGWIKVGLLSGSPTNDNGTGAWSINDNTSAKLQYRINWALTPTQSNMINQFGWHLSWKTHIVTTNLDPHSLAAVVNLDLFQILPGDPNYVVRLGRDGNDLKVGITDNIEDGGTKTFTLPGMGAGFRTYDLFGTPGTADVQLYVDNVLLTNWNGQPNNGKRLEWGSDAGVDTGHSNWA